MPDNQPKEFSRAIENIIADFRGLPTDRSRSKKRQPAELSAMLDELLVKYRISHDSIEHSIRDQWRELVGTANASYSHPLAVERGLLVVLVSHAVVRNELFMHKDSISEKLRKLPGCAGIRGIALRSG